MAVQLLKAHSTGSAPYGQAIGRTWHHLSRPTEALPQTADGSLFTISGGRINLLAIVGEVTTVIETQANNTKLKFNGTATGADQDLCAVLNITADAVGEIYTISGTVADALRSDLLIGLNSLSGAGGLILSAGIIELDCAASNTGSVKWDIWYELLDESALVIVS